MAIRAMEAVAPATGHGMRMGHAPEAASETFLTGGVLVASGGSVAEAGADPTGIVGIANEPASGTTGNDVGYVPAIEGIIFEATLDDSGDFGTHAVVATNRLVGYGIAVDGTSGHWYVDVADTGNVRFVVTEIVDPLTTVQARVRGYFTREGTIYNNG